MFIFQTTSNTFKRIWFYFAFILCVGKLVRNYFSNIRIFITFLRIEFVKKKIFNGKFTIEFMEINCNCELTKTYRYYYFLNFQYTLFKSIKTFTSNKFFFY